MMMMMMRVTHIDDDDDNVSITSAKDELGRIMVKMVRFNYKLLYEMGMMRMMIETLCIVMIWAM